MNIKLTLAKNLSLIILAWMFASCGIFRSSYNSPTTFTNPLLPRGADPWNIYKDGFYFYTQTMGDRIEIWKTKNISDLATAPHKTVWRPQPGTDWSKQLWAPEVHFINDKWYVYFAADDGNNRNHRMYVIENSSKDPLQGEWILKGKVADSTNRWAIDGSVFRYKNQWYMTWAGWEGGKNGKQDIYLAKMANPWTIEGQRVRISAPVYDWEKFGDLTANPQTDDPAHVDVNEGPQILEHKKKLFLVYSASGCWTDHYSLGMLTFTGNNLLDSASWTKSSTSVFKQSPENGVYAPGHNSFFKSPNGKEDWILYHANKAPNMGCGGNRSPRAQRFTWNKDGTPNFGIPVKEGVPIAAPK